MEVPYKILKVRRKGHIVCLSKYVGYYCLVIPLKIKDYDEAKTLSSACKSRTEYCNFGFMGNRCRVYTNGVTEHIKPMIPLIKDKVYNDCIKNPRKYLEN